MKKLFIWIMLFTRVNNEVQTSNKDIKEAYLKRYPNDNINKSYLSVKVGQYLKDIYPELITSGRGEFPKCYNIELLPEPRQDLRRCTLDELL